MYNFDQKAVPLVNDAAKRIVGQTVDYTANGRTFPLTGTWDEAWSQVKMSGGRAGAVPISTTNPRFTVYDIDFPPGFSPAKKQTLVHNGATYEVFDVQPDGFNATQLDLIKKNP